jgi:hypothetical protein
MADRMAVVFDSYHHTAEILCVGDEDECMAEIKAWWDDMIDEPDWDDLDWYDDGRGNMVQSTFDPMVVICGTSIAYEHFGEVGFIYLFQHLYRHFV